MRSPRRAPGETATILERRAANLALLFFLVVATAGCPVPIGYTEVSSAPVSGVYRHSDGTAVPGAWVSVSTDGRDSTCSHSTLNTVTDSLGRFWLPATRTHHSVRWVIPNLDRAPPSYAVCIRIKNAIQQAYLGTGSLTEDASSDFITCLDWEWNSRLRVACSGTADRNVEVGGQWKTADSGGWYRAIVARDDDPRVFRPHIYLQWVEGAAPGFERVVLTSELQVDHNVWVFYDPVIWQEGQKWYLSLEGLRHVFMNDTKSAHVRFRLGPPGEATTVPAQ
jgi:hypothetical protein